MNAMDLLNAMDMVDEECIEKAKKQPGSRKTVWITIASLAACFAIIFCIPRVMNLRSYMSEAESSHAYSSVAVSNSITTVKITDADILVYYVDGDKLSSEEQHLSFTKEAIFTAWREKNGIGEEVKLIDWKVEDNGYSTTFEFQGNEYIKYTLPNYFILTLTVSENLKDYYDTVDSELLLESLKQTMKSYSNVEYDEIHVLFE